jgi:hypothetical protein
MNFQLAALSAEMISRQASVAVQEHSADGDFASISLSFTFAEGHYGKRQLLEKAKRIVDEVSTYLKAEIAKSP